MKVPPIAYIPNLSHLQKMYEHSSPRALKVPQETCRRKNPPTGYDRDRLGAYEVVWKLASNDWPRL